MTVCIFHRCMYLLCKLEFLVRQSPASLNINSTNFRILFRNNIYNITGLILICRANALHLIH
nr:MAG TPA: hypothetical protein [Caudoviricetes sp.]DAU93946.1 MAG TPA: hypothetical protein [Caudoviricetes sp.]